MKIVSCENVTLGLETVTTVLYFSVELSQSHILKRFKRERQKFSWKQADLSTRKGSGACLWYAVRYMSGFPPSTPWYLQLRLLMYLRLIGRDENGTRKDMQPFAPVVVLSLLPRCYEHTHTHTNTLFLSHSSFRLVSFLHTTDSSSHPLLSVTHYFFRCILLYLSLSLSALLLASLSFVVRIIHLSLLSLSLPLFSPLPLMLYMCVSP